MTAAAKCETLHMCDVVAPYAQDHGAGRKRGHMKRRVMALTVVAMFASGVSALAHHSFAATYREDETVTIEGDLVQFLFRNPHSFVQVLVKEKDGSRVRYAVEWGGAGQLGEQGVTRETLKAGDHVIITGSPARNSADHMVRMITLRRPKDGFGWGLRSGQTFD
jgi:hypothetical protein